MTKFEADADELYKYVCHIMDLDSANSLLVLAKVSGKILREQLKSPDGLQPCVIMFTKIMINEATE